MATKFYPQNFLKIMTVSALFSAASQLPADARELPKKQEPKNIATARNNLAKEISRCPGCYNIVKSDSTAAPEYRRLENEVKSIEDAIVKLREQFNVALALLDSELDSGKTYNKKQLKQYKKAQDELIKLFETEQKKLYDKLSAAIVILTKEGKTLVVQTIIRHAKDYAQTQSR
jgi:predicted Zn-ribbon and HTH transcriptional regulator